MDNINRVKLCLDIKLIGDSSIDINMVLVDKEIHNGQSQILYICNDGFVFEKTSGVIKYSPHRLIMPAYIDKDKKSDPFHYTFLDNQTRYQYLKALKCHLAEFTGSGYFGTNDLNRVLMYENFWFVY